MTTSDHSTGAPGFEVELRAFLDDEAGTGRPPYLADVLVRSAVMRQRPAWSFPGRLLPMPAIGERRLTLATPAMGPVVLILSLGLLLLAAAVALVASRPRLPAPYGPAANGLVAYDLAGDIVTVDPVTGVTAAIVTGPNDDTDPVWSRDGTALVFLRDGTRLVVTRLDGSPPTVITPDPHTGIDHYSFSPDGRQVAYTAGTNGAGALWLANADGSGSRHLDVGMNVQEAAWRPPDGAELIFTSAMPIGEPNGLYAVDTRSGAVRTIAAPEPGVLRDVAEVSPDGSRIAYAASMVAADPEQATYRVRVIASDGSGDRVLPMPADAVFQDSPEWSNDGTRLAMFRGYAPQNMDMVVAIIPADESGPGIESPHGVLAGCCENRMEWAPDDTRILVQPLDADFNPVPQLLVDPTTGAISTAPWGAKSLPAWQRLASP